MAIPDPPKAGSPFCALWTGGWNPKTPKINNFFIPEITLRGGLLPGYGVDEPETGIEGGDWCQTRPMGLTKGGLPPFSRQRGQYRTTAAPVVRG